MTRRGLFAALGALVAGGLVGQDNGRPVAAKSDAHLAETIQAKLDELLDLQDKNTVVELNLDGHKILRSLKALKRESGRDLGLA